MQSSSNSSERLLNFAGSYEKYELIDDPNGAIHAFTHVSFGNPLSKNIVCLPGTYSLFCCVPHYFHFLKEYLAFYLYYKNKYDNSLKYLWIDHNKFMYPKNQNMPHICDFTFKRIDMFSGARVADSEIHESTYLVEKIVVMFDSQHALLNKKVKQSNYWGTPDLNKELALFFQQYAERDDLSPKKIFLSRKIVSEELPKYPENSQEGISWKRRQISLRYNEPWVENTIEDFFADNDYVSVQLSGMTIPEQVKLFYNATDVAGLLGTAFYNGIFSNSGTNFIAIRTSPAYWYDFENDIKSVITANFNYVNVYTKDSPAQIKEILARSTRLS